MSLDELRRQHPWPATKPAVPANPHGWFQEASHHWILRRRFTACAPAIIVELGSWLGQSTRYFLTHTDATVICVDHWQGSADINDKPECQALLPVLYETFLVNQWDWRQRVIPLRMDTLAGLAAVHAAAVQPSCIFFDSTHTYEHLQAELELALRCFPEAQLHGDDWATWDGVQRAVREFARDHDRAILAYGNAWSLYEPWSHREPWDDH